MLLMVSALEDRCAKMFNKESAMFVPTATMGNLICCKFVLYNCNIFLVECYELLCFSIIYHMQYYIYLKFSP